jgi:hypothetical protein
MSKDRNEYMKDYRNSPEGKAKRKAWTDANRGRRQREEREKYAALTPEQKKARREKTAEWKAQHPRYREQDKLKKFGLTVEEYDQMMERQGKVCAICNRPPHVVMNGSVKRLAVDHDHATGRVRGLLCDHCNRGMGLLRDSVETLKKAVEYLRNYS